MDAARGKKVSRIPATFGHEPAPGTWTDTHIHLTDPPIFQDLENHLKEAAEAGLSRFVIPGYRPFSWHRSREIWRLHPDRIRRAVGLHPLFLEKYTLDVFADYWVLGEVHAVGEIGFDNRSSSSMEDQEKFFRYQLDFAARENLPVIIHCVGWVEKTLEVLREYRHRIRGVMHSLSASREMARGFLDLDFHISFSGSVTLPKHRKVRELAAYVPLERVLLETDAPYVANCVNDSGKSLPGDFFRVLDAFASIRGIGRDALYPVLEHNARGLFP